MHRKFNRAGSKIRRRYYTFAEPDQSLFTMWYPSLAITEFYLRNLFHSDCLNVLNNLNAITITICDFCEKSFAKCLS